MATHDYSIANATGAAFRADLNANLLAIATMNSSSAEPPVPYPGMFWTDLSTGGDGTVRRRNAANTGWLTDIGVDSVARSAAAAAQTTANAALPKAGGTMTGAIVLPATDPTGLQATSRTFTDATYQLKLLTPVAGSLLVGGASAWTTKLDPGSANSVLAVVGGLPTWQLTAQSASANSLVRTLADGTIDPSFIPAVASGLKYRGTFKPAVNAEYPTTGGSGAAGAPATGDFWVVDGLTTGGYTYLTGSLAGVTVYNGDSIAFTGTTWYRMGSSVSLQGYLKIDGSTAMTGALNMGTQNIVNVANITARSGTPPTISGFSLDATNIILSPQRGTSGPDLATMPAGQLGTDLGRMQLFVGASASNTPLIPLTFFSANTAYPTSSYVYNSADGYAYRAKSAIVAGAFDATKWARLIDASGGLMGGTLTFGTGSALAMRATIPLQFLAGDNAQVNSYLALDGGSGETRWYRRLTNGTYEVALAIGANATYITRATLDIGANVNGALAVNGSGGNAFSLNVNNPTLANTVDSVQLMSRLGVFSGNSEYLDSYIYRKTAGSSWTSTRWRIRRMVDATPQGWIDFGNSGDGRMVILGFSNVETAWVDNQGWFTCATQLVLNCGAGVNPILFKESLTYNRYYITADGTSLNFNCFADDSASYLATPLKIVRNTPEVQIRTWLRLWGFSGQDAQGVIYWGATNTVHTWFDANNFRFSHAVFAPAFNPTSDERVKENITPQTPRNCDIVPFYSYNRTDMDGRLQRGTVAQRIAEMGWTEYVTNLPAPSGSPEDERLSLDIAGLTLEIALNLRDRVIALEAAAIPPEPETEF